MARRLAALLLCLLSPLVLSTALAANEKIVYHLHSSDLDTMHRAITNLENLIRGMPGQDLDIKLLLQGESIQLLNPFMHNERLNQRFRRLQDSGVQVEVKRENYLRNAQFLDGSPALVSNIFTRLIELQRQGYHYITP